MGASELILGVCLAVACALLAGLALRLRAERRQHRQLFEHLPQTAVTVFDDELKIRFAAGPALKTMGSVPEEIEGKFLLGMVPQAQRDALITHYRAALRGESRSFEFRSLQTGRDYWVRVVPLTNQAGGLIGGVSVALDVSDRKQPEAELGSRALDIDAVTEATRALARSVDPATARTSVCEGARQVAGAPVAVLFEPGRGGDGLVPTASVGKSLGGLALELTEDSGAGLAFIRAEETFVRLGDETSEADREFMRRARARAVLWHPVIRDRAAIGVLAVAWREETAGVPLRLSAMIDLLAAEAAVAIGRADMLGQLEHLARTDSLTGLPNRRFWEQQLPRELARSGREDQPMCVAMLDLDHFKAYNDRHGHQAGDRLLSKSAGAWREALRPYDVLARYGGEEFSVILPNCRIEDALTLVDRLRSETADGESCSAGIAEWDGEESPESLVGRADAALYRAKRAGRNRTVTASLVPADPA
jgi:diguanylate cyclase (GGDEF)-like protein/PAS domain S-box-containing protein